MQKVVVQYIYDDIGYLELKHAKETVLYCQAFLKSYCLFISPKSTKEPALKVLKLSVKH